MMNTMFQTRAENNFPMFSAPSNLNTVPEIPEIILRSPLMQRGGFDVFSGIADETIRKNLLAEAIAQQSVITESLITEDDAEEIRGGMPRRKFLSSSGGAFQTSFYQAQWLIDFLRSITTPFLRPTGESATFSYYMRTGDFLDVHRDIETCDVAVITCLKNSFGADKTGGRLCLYPARTSELLSEIKKTPEKNAHKIFLEEGQTLVMYGGIVPHALLPVAENQTRIISVLCYQAI